MKTFSVVIPAAGTGERFGSKTPKQFILIKDKPIIFYTVLSFVNIFKVYDYILTEIVISCNLRFKQFLIENVIKEIIANFKSIKITLVDGYQFRHKSIFNCIKHLSLNNKTHLVVIHDAVRPIIKKNLLKKLFKNAVHHGASGPVCKLVSTILNVDEDNFAKYALVRNQFRSSEMPQVFLFEIILQSYNKSSEHDLVYGTECLDLVRKYLNINAKLVEYDANTLFKITYKKDFYSAQGMIQNLLTYDHIFNNQSNSKIDLQFHQQKFDLNLKNINKIVGNQRELNIDTIRFIKNNKLNRNFNFLFIIRYIDSMKNIYDHLDLVVEKHIKLIYIYIVLNVLDINLNHSFRLSKNQVNNHCFLICLKDNVFESVEFYEKITFICLNSLALNKQLIYISN